MRELEVFVGMGLVGGQMWNIFKSLPMELPPAPLHTPTQCYARICILPPGRASLMTAVIACS